MLSLAANLFLELETLELNAWHQNLRNFALYTTKKKKYAILLPLGVDVNINGQNSTKIMPKLPGQSGLDETSNWPFYTLDAKGRSNLLPIHCKSL